MTTRTINTKKIASYGAVLASVGISSHAQAGIVDLESSLPNSGSNSRSLLYSTAGFTSFFDLLGNGNSFSQFNDVYGQSLNATNSAQIRLVNASSTLNSNFTGGPGINFNSHLSTPYPDPTTGTHFVGFITGDKKVGWIKINFHGYKDTIEYLAAAYNNALGGTIHVGTLEETGPKPPVPGVPEPSIAALIGLGLLASGASGIRKLRRTPKSQGSA